MHAGAQSCDTEVNLPFEEGDSHGNVCEPQSKLSFYIQEQSPRRQECNVSLEFDSTFFC